MKAQGIDGDSGEPRCQELRLPSKSGLLWVSEPSLTPSEGGQHVL